MKRIEMVYYMDMEFPVISRDEINSNKLKGKAIDPLTEVIRTSSLEVLVDSQEALDSVSGDYVLVRDSKADGIQLKEDYVLLPVGYSAYINPKSLVQVNL